jgi:hypothetical protein
MRKLETSSAKTPGFLSDEDLTMPLEFSRYEGFAFTKTPGFSADEDLPESLEFSRDEGLTESPKETRDLVLFK